MNIFSLVFSTIGIVLTVLLFENQVFAYGGYGGYDGYPPYDDFYDYGGYPPSFYADYKSNVL